MFPSLPDPKGDPEGWTVEELGRWLDAVGLPIMSFFLYLELGWVIVCRMKSC